MNFEGLLLVILVLRKKSRRFIQAYAKEISECGHIKALTFRQAQKIFPECQCVILSWSLLATSRLVWILKNDEVLLDLLQFLEFQDFFFGFMVIV
ncbi:hypothetical protein TNCT_100141 [Trichonephila clavata]|uniref:Uncharacterized protein n=1 Tax=Trichonephila clavata TaxID=2740835 RepID=A0A8X6H3K5_TRICU|nr:hypothetical protein TNCT_100141 [Trichonephila clavata]